MNVALAKQNDVLAKQNKYVVQQLMEMTQRALDAERKVATPQPMVAKKQAQQSGPALLQMSKAQKKARQKEWLAKTGWAQRREMIKKMYAVNDSKPIAGGLDAVIKTKK
jgi:hypothetical protein